MDHEYLENNYETTLESIKKIVEKVIREDLKDGGLNIKYYSWSNINFKKGAMCDLIVAVIGHDLMKFFFLFRSDFTAILSIANCKNTWDIFYASRKETLLLMALTDADCPRFPIHEALMVSNSISNE